MHTSTYRHIIIFLIFPLFVRAQHVPTPLDDLAYVIDQEEDEEKVQQALYSFHKITGAAFRIVTLFEENHDEYPVKESSQQWLQQQTQGIFMTVTVSQPGHGYVSTDIKTTPSLAGILTVTERNYIVQEIIEPVFKDSPVPNDACTKALLVGIQAIQNALQQNDYSIETLVRETLLLLQEENKVAVDSLKKNVVKQSEALEKVIQKGYFYPPRIKGPNDEFIGEGMSKYAAPIMRSEATKAQMEPIMLELDSTRNQLYWADFSLQRTLKTKNLIEDTLHPQAFKTFAAAIEVVVGEQAITKPEGFMQAIRKEVERALEKSLEE